MWTRHLEDLRFVIGLFFGVLAAILIGTGLLIPHPQHLNLITGVCMGVFSAIMVLLSIRDE